MSRIRNFVLDMGNVITVFAPAHFVSFYADAPEDQALLAQHNQVTAVDIVPEKVALINSRRSPIQDEYIEKYLAEDAAGTRKLDLTATLDPAAAYTDADFVVIAAPTNVWALGSGLN